MPRALIVTEPPVAPEPFRLALLGIGYNVVDEIDDAQRLVKSAIEAAHARCLETGRPGTRRNETPRRSLWRDEAVLLSDRIVMLTNGPAATIGEIRMCRWRVRVTAWHWRMMPHTSIAARRYSSSSIKSSASRQRSD